MAPECMLVVSCHLDIFCLVSVLVAPVISDDQLSRSVSSCSLWIPLFDGTGEWLYVSGSSFSVLERQKMSIWLWVCALADWFGRPDQAECNDDCKPVIWTSTGVGVECTARVLGDVVHVILWNSLFSFVRS
ncbi:hypothetical protein N665_2801s0001 [Sinapis alba]|nr:hypothetical protein N665_2801s0001 [Sinapis alba]